MNLLSVRCVRSLLGWRWFPIVPQLVMLAIFGLLIGGGIGVTVGDVLGNAAAADASAFAKAAKVLRNTNIASLMVWSYWWPMVIVTSILLGRVWCMVCPMELVTSLAGRIGLRRKAPHFLRSGWVITIFYATVLIVGVHTLAIHRIPHRMAFYLLTLFGAAVVVGLIYEKRAFCSYVCPVGHLLGLYALIAPVEWRADKQAVCESCRTKDCIAKKNHYKIIARSCTSNLYPATIKDNRDCLLCTQCLKVCPHANLRLSARLPFADFFGTVQFKGAQTAFVLLVSAFVMYEILSEWARSKAVLTWIPRHVCDALGVAGPMTGTVSAVIMFILFPAILLLAVIALAKVRSSAPIGTVARNFALLLLPTMGGAHLIKVMLKMTSRIPYWRHAFSDPVGVATAQKIVDGTLILDKSAPDALFPIISVAAAAVLIIALTATLLIFRKSPAIRKLDPGARAPLLLGTLAYWSIFAWTLFKWRL